MTIEARRREYLHAELDEREVDRDPLGQFTRWMAEAQAAALPEPTAMTLATASPEGRPSARTVLLKSFGPEGFMFFTDFRSRKARELAANPQACLLFFWVELERQVRIEGLVSRVSGEAAAAYFATRPRGSQLGAWASHQSTVLSGGRAELEAQLRAVEARFGDGPVPLPAHWGGFCLTAEEFEFWQGRRHRLHDRIRYLRTARGWTIERVSP